VDEQLLDAIETHQEENQVQIRDQLEALKACVAKLDPKARQLIHMRFDTGQPISGIATQFKVSVQAIYKSLAKIHGQLLRCVRLTLAGEDPSHG
jgi:DNA-directed RNA polymerase specialized sigma24 family protein